MGVDGGHRPAAEPEDLARLFVERGNARDIDGLVALYEPDAVVAFPPGQVSTGSAAIRQAYGELLAGEPMFTPGDQQPALRNGDLALTATRLPDGGVTVEVARRQPDGTWRWVIDQPDLLG